jgi:exopolysaccharide production protein ExoZ
VTNITDVRTLHPVDHGGDKAVTVSNIVVPANSVLRNARLQHLRGMAALFVVMYHGAEYLHQLRGDARYAEILSSFLGVYGVAAFFVLSGYLMSRLSLRGDGHRFLIDRALRIYPLMLIFVALAALLYWITGYPRRPNIVALTLVPTGPRNYFLGVEWTLLVEVSFYVIIAVAMITGQRKRLEPLFVVWLVALAALPFTGMAPAQTPTPTLTQFFAQAPISAFLMGFLLPRIIDANWVPRGGALIVMAGPIAAMALFTGETGGRWIAGLSSLFFVAGALKARQPQDEGLVSRVWQRLGDASYALYLCHVPVIVITGNLLPESVKGGTLWLGWVLASVAVAIVFGPLDLNLHQRLKAWSQSLRPSTVVAASICLSALLLSSRALQSFMRELTPRRKREPALR